MLNNNIVVYVKERFVSVQSNYTRPVAGNVSHDYLLITFDHEWDDLEKRVTFSGSGTVVTITNWNGTAPLEIPFETLAEEGLLKFTIVGSKDGVDRLVTTLMSDGQAIEVIENGEDEGVAPSKPTQDLLRNVETLYNDLEDKVETDYYRGPKGDKGDRGATGPQGPAGPQGPTGTIGELTPEMRRNYFRGSNLGGSISEAQLTAIRNGTFSELCIGDYWTIGGIRWRIADMDYWWNTGDDPAFTKHHLVIVPDTSLYTAKMNETNDTTGAYVGSQMYTTNLEQAKTKINECFPGLVLSHRLYLQNATTNGYPSAGAWYDSTVELMTEEMVYGCKIFGPMGDGSFVPNNYTVDKSQLALFQMAPKYISNRQWFWLRDVVSAADFATVSHGGGAAYGGASNTLGVRPAFPIG